MTANTQAIERLEYRVNTIHTRVDTIYTNQHVALFIMYDEYCRTSIIGRSGPHPSWYTQNPTYGASGAGTSAPDGDEDDNEDDDDSMDN